MREKVNFRETEHCSKDELKEKPKSNVSRYECQSCRSEEGKKRSEESSEVIEAESTM